MQTNIFMNEFNLTKDDTIENNVSSSKLNNNDSKKNKSPKK